MDSRRGGHPAGRVLIEPFDRCVPLLAPPLARQVSRRAWVRRLADELAAEARLDAPRAAAGARIDLHAYQLDPVARLLRGEAARVLLADAVGLGKTIEAGLVIAEVLARTPAARVLLVVPAGLRAQWIGELRERFHLEATRCDAVWLAAQSTALPAGVNPWTCVALPVVSIDFLKRPEVINALDAIAWDLLVVDEAHAASAGSDRGAAVAALARRARLVVLASATPHDGDAQRFAALCATGAFGRDDPLLVFRRPPGTAGRPPAAVPRPVRVRVSPPHRRMHALLDAYANAVRAAGARAGGAAGAAAALALTVLRKRAWSSARALWLTAMRRRALLAAATGDGVAPAQAALPLGPAVADEGDGEPAAAVLGAPGLAHPRREAAWLGAIAEAAHRAARDEPKLAVLLGWLRRTREPAIVFTEYRDTLVALARALARAGHATACLHGAQREEERHAALDAFSGGRARVLVATDTASEGLNLQARCRTVICFDVPWSPTRIAQRVGRVDRLGQARRVHALLLVGAGTGDEDLVGRLGTRAGRIEAALDAGGAAAATGSAHAHDPVAFLAHLRRFLRPSGRKGGRGGPGPTSACGGDRRNRRADTGRPVFTTLRLRAGAWPAGDGLLWLVCLRLRPAPPAGGPDVERHLVPVFLPWRSGAAADATRRCARLLLARGAQDACDRAAAALAPRVARVRGWIERRWRLQGERDEAIDADTARRLAAALVQPGLFDRRTTDAGPGSGRSQPATLQGAAPRGGSGSLDLDACVALFAHVRVRRSGPRLAPPRSP